MYLKLAWATVANMSYIVRPVLKEKSERNKFRTNMYKTLSVTFGYH